MKRVIIASTVALGFACVGSIGAAQDQTNTTTLPNFTVTAPVGQYETYIIDLHTGFGLAALVGNTHKQYVQASRAADRSETLRKQGMATQPLVTVAIDNSDGPGVARRILLSDPQNTVAIVDVYCKRAVPAGSKHCRLFSRQVPGQRIASVGHRDLGQEGLSV